MGSKVVPTFLRPIIPQTKKTGGTRWALGVRPSGMPLNPGYQMHNAAWVTPLRGTSRKNLDFCYVQKDESFALPGIAKLQKDFCGGQVPMTQGQTPH